MVGEKNYSSGIFWAIIITIFIFASSVVGLVTDFWWFSSLGFKEIFLISIKAKIALFLGTSVIFYLFASLNLWISSYFRTGPKISGKLKNAVLIGLSIFIGVVCSAQWFELLQYLNQVPFGLADPIFGKDVAFYVFSLPVLLMIRSFAMAVVLITSILVVVNYLHHIVRAKIIRGINSGPQPAVFLEAIRSLKRNALRHVAILGSLLFVLVAGKYYLTRYSIMYSEKGIVVGAGYTDVVVFLPIIKFLMGLAVLMVVLFVAWFFFISKVPSKRRTRIVGAIVLGYLVIAFLAPAVIPGLVQGLKVSPNELKLETPYIKNNIEFTKIAYGLDNVVEKDFPVDGKITAESLEKDSKTMDNIRLLDWRPLTETYKQTQEIRLYYDLAQIDIDRYILNGTYTEVMLSPRELNQRQIVTNAQTWVNLHLVYTHGFGFVMSPVNSVTKEGLPNYLVQDIPPKSVDPSLEIDTPQIYYGETDNNFVVVNTGTDEFDYPKGTSNQYINYGGKGGVVLDSFIKKAFMALRFKDFKILLSSDIKTDSKILFDRSIQKRIKKITPFLELDYDPYIIIDNGRLKWIQDAYTVTGNFPYSEKIDGINYIRNSVKVVVDAYDGSVVYYVADSSDPIMKTYANIFPGNFVDISEMPDSLRAHVRYPEALFNAQSQIYSIYHMEDPTVFYNKEDAWQMASETYGTGQQVIVEPYYIIMKLPNASKEEFILMSPFTPLKKDNMIAWMAARSDGDNYGSLLVYEFPKDKLVYGPLQIEAKFDQDAIISQQLTLWSQRGSSVTRGNLLVIPIGDALLYIEPLYLQAEKGKLPQLKKVLVSDGEQVVMEDSLGEALEKLFGTVAVEVADSDRVETNHSPIERVIGADLVDEANKYYKAVLEAMASNDWKAMGENFDTLGDVLTEMKSVDKE